MSAVLLNIERPKTGSMVLRKKDDQENFVGSATLRRISRN